MLDATTPKMPAEASNSARSAPRLAAVAAIREGLMASS
jgi:hypothetical protein